MKGKTDVTNSVLFTTVILQNSTNKNYSLYNQKNSCWKASYGWVQNKLTIIIDEITLGKMLNIFELYIHFPIFLFIFEILGTWILEIVQELRALSAFPVNLSLVPIIDSTWFVTTY